MAAQTERQHLLLIDSEPATREALRENLVSAGYQVSPYPTLGQVPRPEASEHVDAALVSIDWPANENGDRISRLKRRLEGVPLILLCPHSRVSLGVQGLRHGADDYLTSPVDRHELRSRLGRILEQRELDSRLLFFQNELAKKSFSKKLEAHSPAMRAVEERVRRVAPSRSTVLIFGESGVGKELVARSIHIHSPRRDRPFIALNCAAMAASLIESELFGHEKGAFTGAHARTRGKFEIAHRGTLFLDEIGEMDPGTQSKLLRVLEEREFMRVGGNHTVHVDVRVIAATNADLERMVTESRFRQDLYYRLKVVTITVPPLRERREDTPLLAETFTEELCRSNAVPRKIIDPQTMQALRNYHWPGNVRELKNLLESVIVSTIGDEILPEHLPQSLRKSLHSAARSPLDPGTTLSEMERELIRRTLEHTGGNRTHSASLLGIGVRTLQRKIHTYQIEIPPKRRRSRRTKGDLELS